jgi:hypothetical protein
LTRVSIYLHKKRLSEGMGCRVKPGNDKPEHFAFASAIPRRDAPELCMNLSPMKTEGVGNAGCPLHPQPRAQSVGGTRV